jgi:FkbM family methyltransferase
MNWPLDYGLNQDHCESVLRGEYEVPFEGAPVILDIGANVGAFARWAKNRWPDSKIHSYEPHPANHALLCRTVTDFELRDVFVYNLAVSNSTGPGQIHMNGFNCGEWSLAKIATTTGQPVDVNCIDAAELPDADVIKVDTEGAEPMILSRLSRCGRLKRPQAIMLEYHADTAVKMLTEGLAVSGFKPFAHQEYSQHRGTIKFLKSVS